jgi:hypothetical protein
MLTKNALNEDEVSKILRKILVRLGGGQVELPLANLLPMQSQMNLMDILEEYQRQL